MQFLYNNVAAIHVAFVCTMFAWLFGGTRADSILLVMPWVTALLLEAMICFPQHHDGETTYDARTRVWEAMRRDPLVWVSLGLIALLMVPFANHGLCPVCDYPAIQAGADPKPVIPFFPFCVNRMEHLNIVMWFVPSLVAMVAAKHALLKRGKRTLLAIIVWNGFALGLLGAVQQMFGAKGPLWIDTNVHNVYFFSTFGYPNMAGDYFTTLFGIAIGLWRWNLDEAAASEASASSSDDGAHRHSRHSSVGSGSEGRFWKKHHFMIPAVVFFFCALDTLSRATVMLITALAVLFFLHTSISAFSRMKKVKRVKAGALGLFVIVVIALSAVMFMPDKLQREVNTISTPAVLDRITGKGEHHVRVATDIWKDNMLFGVGGWGYKHFCMQYMNDKEIVNLQWIGSVNVHNDYLQFLAEHGLVGFALIVAVVVLLLLPVARTWYAMANAIRFLPRKRQPPRPTLVFVLPAPVFCILAASVATLIHAFGDCVFRSPAILSLFLVSLASLDGFLPRLKHENHHSR